MHFDVNSFATSTKSIKSVTDLWAWRIDNELKWAAVEVKRRHVLILLVGEKDLSGVAVVAGLTSNNSRILTALGRRHSRPLGRDSTSSSMSRKQSLLIWFEVCRLLLLKIDWCWFLYHNLPRGKRSRWMHLRMRWFWQ